MKVYRFKCEDCGSKKYEKLDENIYKCSYCGRVEEVYRTESEENKKKEDEMFKLQKEYVETVTQSEKTIRNIGMLLIIAVFGGILGLHKFMEGKIKMGVLYIFTWGLFGVGLMIDIFRYVFEMIKICKHHNDKMDNIIEKEEQLKNE